MAAPVKTLIYENAFSKSQEAWKLEMEREWLLEGRGITECNGCLSLRSEHFTVPRDHDGHFNLWLRREFPKNVAFEWDFRYSEPGDQGLAIVMWAARGRSGCDIFDPSLPERKGERMEDMHSGAINCYHTSYIARGRGTANLRKNYGFHMMCNGDDISQSCAPEEWHRVSLSHFNDVVTLSFDGKTSYSHLDDGSVGGPPIRTGGAFGFRQQNNLHRGDYRNFQVYALS
jgi:hypothetical protein